MRRKIKKKYVVTGLILLIGGIYELISNMPQGYRKFYVEEVTLCKIDSPDILKSGILSIDGKSFYSINFKLKGTDYGYCLSSFKPYAEGIDDSIKLLKILDSNNLDISSDIKALNYYSGIAYRAIYLNNIRHVSVHSLNDFANHVNLLKTDLNDKDLSLDSVHYVGTLFYVDKNIQQPKKIVIKLKSHKNLSNTNCQLQKFVVCAIEI